MNPPGWAAEFATTKATYGGADASGGDAKPTWMESASSEWASSDGTIFSAHMAHSRHSMQDPKGPASCVDTRSLVDIGSCVFVEYATAMDSFRYRVACEQQRSPERSRSPRSVDSRRTRRKGCSGRRHEIKHHADCYREGAGHFRPSRESTACSSHEDAMTGSRSSQGRRQQPKRATRESRARCSSIPPSTTWLAHPLQTPSKSAICAPGASVREKL